MKRFKSFLILLLLVLGNETVLCQGFSFVLLSDLHFRGDALHYNLCKELICSINSACEDKSKINVPRFVWVLGDITDNGKKEQWDEYLSLFGLEGDSLLKCRVFESFGNHDGNIDGYVRTQVKERNKVRLGDIFTDSLQLHCSWDVNGVHFINLNLYPGDKWEDGCDWCNYFKDSFREPQFSLSFLENDLRENIKNLETPIIIGFHIGFDDFGLKWWTENQRDRFYNVIKDYNVLAIFSGHNHEYKERIWRGIRVINVESPFNLTKGRKYMKVILENDGRLLINHISY